MLKLFRAPVFAILIMMLIFPEQGMAYRCVFRHKGTYHLTANTALLWNPVSRQRFFDLGADREVFPASTTKVLTALMVLENLPLDRYVTVSQHATQVPQSKMDLRTGESYRVRDLLYGLILKSANDAAVTLAVSVSGSEAKFVELMNNRARQLGANDTHFANSHGLPADHGQCTSAYDMFLMFREALKQPFFHDAIEEREKVIESLACRKIPLRSHNKALFKNWKARVWGKTGYTLAAHACFIGHVLKGKEDLIIGVFGCAGSTRWDDIKYIIEKYGGVDL